MPLAPWADDYVPIRDVAWAAMVTLTSPCVEDWETYSGLVLDICRTLHGKPTHRDFIG